MVMAADPFSRKKKWRTCAKERLSFLIREEALFKIAYGEWGFL